ncbi:MAG TPA: EAL domain-containing protein [Sphingomicrobium sp.]|nr:EAL domain-containing protein [Sphingomicrobium sp.]
MRPFRSLTARLTVQFALLFAAAMVGASVTLSTVIAGAASRQAERELQSSAAVFEQLWQLKAAEIQERATLSIRNPVLRKGVANDDQLAIRAALQALSRRLGVESVLLVTADGKVVSSEGSLGRSDGANFLKPLQRGTRSGISVLSGRLRELVAVPIPGAMPARWIVTASDPVTSDIRGLERLSAVPLHATLLVRSNGRWSAAGRAMGLTAEAAQLAEAHARSGAFGLTLDGKPSRALAKSLPGFFGDGRAILLLAYPKASAVADAKTLQLILGLVTLVGLLLVGLATWRAAQRITQPLARLDDAAGRLAAGEHVQVRVRGEDELARLAGSFNAMVGKIAEREQRITQLAFNDTLTGLPNRTMFQQQLEHQFRSLEGGDRLFALHCLDLDQFKVVNDTLGHPAGDALLIEAAHRVRQAARGHFVARLGGDEFVVLQTVGDDRDAIDRLARDILGEITRPLSLEGNEIRPSTSIGIAIAPQDGRDGGTLLRSADLALYRAKEGGRGSYAFFEESLNERAQQRRQLETDLRLALERSELELFYQPLFDLEHNRICSFEALLRWRHPTRGLVLPAEFVHVAEDTGLIVPIGAWVIREASAEAISWPDHVRVAVNVSAVQFHRGPLNETIVHALAESGLPPARFEVEITESIFLDGGDTTLRLLHQLRSLGVRIALDDFGTGYSSLSYLQSFPFDKLKIDRSFIQNLLTRNGASAIVHAITELANALGIETTAEGVEETAQLMELRAHGCSSVQGYLFSEPMTASDVRKLFARGRGKLQNVA